MVSNAEGMKIGDVGMATSKSGRRILVLKNEHDYEIFSLSDMTRILFCEDARENDVEVFPMDRLKKFKGMTIAYEDVDVNGSRVIIVVNDKNKFEMISPDEIAVFEDYEADIHIGLPE